ncbi:DedA family protein [Jiangella anatolica]|uniref:DedA family protein n=2 Tax=Jiangella anatolica TaxID=2670374 RepID=A0A2W2CCL4_9ACTN|nr:DedA family protein [Jiangella anatolica]
MRTPSSAMEAERASRGFGSRVDGSEHDGKVTAGMQNQSAEGDADPTRHVGAARATATGDASPNKEVPSRRPKLSTWTSTPWPERYRPWRGRATRTDVVLMAAFVAVLVFGLAVRPIKPFLLASHPVMLEVLTGDLLAIGAGAAFARIGEAPLWLVVIAGAVGMAKFDWLTWWAGRQWGEGIIQMFTTRERARRYVERSTKLNPWIVRIAVVVAVLPGVPTPIVYAIAGMAGMRLITFLALDLVSVLVVTGLVAGLGYQLGQNAIDVVLLVDRYASLVSLTLIGATFLLPLLRARLRRRHRVIS